MSAEIFEIEGLGFTSTAPKELMNASWINPPQIHTRTNSWNDEQMVSANENWILSLESNRNNRAGPNRQAACSQYVDVKKATLGLVTRCPLYTREAETETQHASTWKHNAYFLRNQRSTSKNKQRAVKTKVIAKAQSVHRWRKYMWT